MFLCSGNDVFDSGQRGLVVSGNDRKLSIIFGLLRNSTILLRKIVELRSSQN
jgi:hypothetical protein